MFLNNPEILNIMLIRVHNTKYLTHFKGVHQLTEFSKCQNTLITEWQKKFYQFFVDWKMTGIVLILIGNILAVDMTSVIIESKKWTSWAAPQLWERSWRQILRQQITLCKITTAVSKVRLLYTYPHNSTEAMWNIQMHPDFMGMEKNYIYKF